MMQDDHRADLDSLLDSYSVLVQELIGLLEKEQQALSQRQFFEIENFTQKKESLVSKLEELEKSRTRLENSSNPDGKEEIRRAFKTRLESLLSRCREANLVNGGVIELSRQFHQRMLGILLGAPAEENKLYDAQGGNTGGKSNQLFAKI